MPRQLIFHLKLVRKILPLFAVCFCMVSTLLGQNACPDGTLWRDQLGGVFFNNYQDAGDPPFTDKWSGDVAPSYTHFFTRPATIVSASLTVRFAGVADNRGP